TVTDADSSASTPTGTLQFFDGGMLLGSGTAGATTSTTATFTLNSPSLTVGAHTITAKFTGTGGYQTSTSANFLQNVQENTTTVVSNAVNPSPFATPPSFTA